MLLLLLLVQQQQRLLLLLLHLNTAAAVALATAFFQVTSLLAIYHKPWRISVSGSAVRGAMTCPKYLQHSCPSSKCQPGRALCGALISGPHKYSSGLIFRPTCAFFGKEKTGIWEGIRWVSASYFGGYPPGIRGYPWVSAQKALLRVLEILGKRAFGRP